MDNITKKGTAAALTEAAIVSLIGEYTESGFSVGDFCFLHDGLDEATFRAWLDRYDRSADDGFAIVVGKERTRPGLKKQPSLFARIGDIELYREVPAAYLKSLKP